MNNTFRFHKLQVHWVSGSCAQDNVRETGSKSAFEAQDPSKRDRVKTMDLNEGQAGNKQALEGECGKKEERRAGQVQAGLTKFVGNSGSRKEQDGRGELAVSTANGSGPCVLQAGTGRVPHERPARTPRQHPPASGRSTRGTAQHGSAERACFLVCGISHIGHSPVEHAWRERE